ncbi:MAG: hypothetical protein ACRD5L_11930, partial [Bryobacteraceae bacterium]
MRREDTVSVLSDFLHVRPRGLLESFAGWARAYANVLTLFRPAADHFSYKCREVREYDLIRGRFEEHQG